MFKNYLILTWRNLKKSGIFSMINILGLAIGLACCILIFLFIQYELRYDKFNDQARNIYRLTSMPNDGTNRKELAVTPAPWAPQMKKDYPEIKEYVRLLKEEKTSVGRPGEVHYNEKDILYADSSLFDVFSISMERGDPKALARPNVILLTGELAQKYFGTADPIGKTLEINSFGRSFNAEVSAIVKELPGTSHFKFNAILSMSSFGDLSQGWSFHMWQSYLLINEKSPPRELESKFSDFTAKYIAQNPQADGNHDIHLQPLLDIHLHSHLISEIGINGDVVYVYILAIIALAILLIACFNFTNLSTARSLSRAKEIGIRKVSGAGRGQLIVQFLGESTGMYFLALAIAILIVVFIMPQFNQLTGRELNLDFKTNYPLILLMGSLVIFVGLTAGLYPAIVLSSFEPVEILKGKKIKNNRGVYLSKLLVTAQFIVSIGLMAGTILIHKQLNYLQDKKLGFEKENTLVLTLPKNVDSLKLESLRTSLTSSPGILSAGVSSSLPGVNIPVNLVNDGSSDLSKAVSLQMLFIDHDFIHTMKMEVLAGRDFSKSHSTDLYEGFVLNEEAVKKLGWQTPDEAIGKAFQWVRPGTVIKSGKVIGVVKDFNITPLTSAVQPLVMHILPSRFQYLYLRFDPSKSGDIVTTADHVFKKLFANQSFEYSFLDETLDALYKTEKKLGTIFGYFSALAILIACLGVLGLSIFSIQQRVKEIGVRKILGASVPSLTGLLFSEYARHILWAMIIATPLIGFGINKWLNGFAYRTEISWWIFPLTGASVLLISFLTVGFQTIKAAIANPINSLRTE